MFSFHIFITFLFWVTSTSTSDLHPLTLKNYKIFDSITGDVFPIRGVAYYPRPNAGKYDFNNIDLFNDDFTDIWSRDIPYFADANVNTIRLYAVDPSKDHEKFMCSLAAKGIYVIVDLQASCEGCQIDMTSAPTCYPASLKTRGIEIIREFIKYDNVLGFSAGNEINLRTQDEYGNAPCQKRFIRDMRKYIASCKNMRQIPVGVVMANREGERKANAQYYNCRTSENEIYENIEWYGLNTYLSCDPSITDGTKATAYQQLKQDIADMNYNIPFILTEYGCLNPTFPTINNYEAQRTFYESTWMFIPTYNDYLAGGLVFEYSTEMANAGGADAFPFTKYNAGNWGLGYFSPANCDDDTIPCVYNPMPNYNNLAKQYASIDISGAPKLKDFIPDKKRMSISQCPKLPWVKPLSSYVWEADSLSNEACPHIIRTQCSASSIIEKTTPAPVVPSQDGAALNISQSTESAKKNKKNSQKKEEDTNAATMKEISILLFIIPFLYLCM